MQDEADEGRWVTTICPRCNHEMEALEAEAGDGVTCLRCGHVFKLTMQFGNFLLERQLGAGGMGAVYLGKDVILKRSVAVKLLSPETAQDEKFVKTFLQEAEITASLNHPNIVHVYAFGEEHGYYYLVMEFIEGGTLDDKIVKVGRVTELEGIEIGLGVARGLECANQRGLIHRDIKPGNIVFGPNNTPKVVDFGLARPMSSMENLTGEIWGTPYYVTPEKLERKPEDFRSDLYSLGATLFHAMAGRPPYEAKDANEVAMKHLSGNVVSLRAFIPTITDSTANAIKKSMARYPEDRHSSYEEFIKELEDAKRRVVAKLQSESKGQAPVVQDTVVMKPVLKEQHVNWVIYLGIAFGLLLLAAAGYTAYTAYTKNAPTGIEGYKPHLTPTPSATSH